MAARDRIVSDPSLARDHEAGVTVTLVQPLIHRQLGAITYEVPLFWEMHQHAAEEAHERLTALHEELASKPVDKSNSRFLQVDDFVYRVYVEGASLVRNAVLMFHHLSNTIEQQLRLDPYGGPMLQRLDKAARSAGIERPALHAGYPGLAELVQVRDAIEHPKASSTYNANEGAWDSVPLAWMLSDKPATAYERFASLSADFVSAWKTVQEGLAAPGTITISKRGIRHTVQAKKPPDGQLKS